VKETKKKKNSSFSALVWVIVILLFSGIGENPRLLLIVVGGSIVLGLIYAAINAARKKNASGESYSSGKKNTTHSHDRLTVTHAELSSCEGIDHYKKQLDGFVASGIIDRKEYHVLLEKYSRQLGNKN